MLNCEHMYLIGMMNLCELRLDSHSFKQQPLNRVGLSHIDNEGVKALVDSICARSLTQKGKPVPSFIPLLQAKAYSSLQKIHLYL